MAGKTLKEGDIITIDGSVYEVYDGTVQRLNRNYQVTLKRVMGWADSASYESAREC